MNIILKKFANCCWLLFVLLSNEIQKKINKSIKKKTEYLDFGNA